MKPVMVVSLAALIAIAGTWSKKKTIETKQVVGGAVILLFFVILEDTQPKLAQQFSWLMVASTVGAYGEDLFGMVGNITTGSTSETSAQIGKK